MIQNYNIDNHIEDLNQQIESISKQLIKLGKTKNNIDMIDVFYQMVKKTELEPYKFYILVKVVQYISESYYDIVSTTPFSLKKWN